MKSKILCSILFFFVPILCFAESDKEFKILEKNLKRFVDSENSFNSLVVKRFVALRSSLESYVNERFDTEACASHAKYELQKVGCVVDDDEIEILLFWIEIEEIIVNAGCKQKFFLPVNRTFGLCSVMSGVMFDLCPQPLFKMWGDVLLELGKQNYRGEEDEEGPDVVINASKYAIAS